MATLLLCPHAGSLDQFNAAQLNSIIANQQQANSKSGVNANTVLAKQTNAAVKPLTTVSCILKRPDRWHRPWVSRHMHACLALIWHAQDRQTPRHACMHAARLSSAMLRLTAALQA